ncbi:MAG: protein kinase [Planctomycetaceae bacterium]|nr:protein kinase [Planctomycetales bacterium]MCB9926643.1 protein kinase [Planctomycetaceae bacterium]
MDQSRRNPKRIDEERLDSLIAEYLQQVDEGALVTAQSFSAQHPEYAEMLREYLDGAARIDAMVDPNALTQSKQDTTRSQTDQDTIGYSRSQVRAGSQPETGAVPFGRYLLLRCLGKGAMGTVYLAEDSQLERLVALKIPSISTEGSLDVVERFYIEARAAATLNHPNICQVHDIGEHEGTPHITMTFIDGPPLSNLIRRQGKLLAESEVIRLVRQVARALANAHQHGILHRDVKPGNILINEHREPIVTDFGLASRLNTDAAKRLTDTGALLGTPAYMSPEQVSGKPELIGPASDQYSLGVILYELLTGRLPFQGSIAAVLAQISRDTPASPGAICNSINPAVEAICMKMLSKAPADRYGSMVDVVNALDAVVADGTSTSGIRVLSKRSSTGKDVDTSSRTGRFSSRLTMLLLPAIIATFAAVWTIKISLDEGGASVSITQREIAATKMLAVSNDSVVRVSPAARTPLPDGPAELVHTLDGHTAAINSLVFSNNGETVFSASGDQTIRAWSVVTGREHFRIDSKFAEWVVAMALSPNGQHLLVARTYSGEPNVCMFSTKTGSFERGFVGLNWKGLDVDVSSDNQKIAAVATNGVARVWSLQTGAIQNTLATGKHDAFAGVQFVGDGDRLLLSNGEPSFGTQLWNLDSNEEALPFANSNVRARGIALSPSEQTFAISQWTRVCIFEVQNQQPIRQISLDYGVQCLEYTSDGRHLVCGGQGCATIWDTHSAEKVHQIDSGKLRFSRIALSPDSRFLVSGGGGIHSEEEETTIGNDDYAIYVWRLPEKVWPQVAPTDVTTPN